MAQYLLAAVPDCCRSAAVCVSLR